MSSIKLVDICPVEWDFKRFRCYRYLTVLISHRLTLEGLQQKFRENRIKNVCLSEDPTRWISWQRKGRPIIYLDLERLRTRVAENTINEFDREDVEHQSSIVLRLLKRFGYATYLRKRVDFLPSRIGYDELERRQYHELIERGIHRRMEIYGLAPIANRKMSRKRVNESKNYGVLKRWQDVGIVTKCVDHGGEGK